MPDRTAAQGRCLCAERGLLGIHEQECEGFGSRSDELCEQAEREARAAGEWPPESPAATTASPVFDSAHVCVDDVIAYVGEGRARLSEPPAAESRSWLRVSRVDEDGIHGYRVNPEEWEADLEYVIVNAQVENNGVIGRG